MLVYQRVAVDGMDGMDGAGSLTHVVYIHQVCNNADVGKESLRSEVN